MKKKNMLLVGAASAILSLASCEKKMSSKDKQENDREALYETKKTQFYESTLKDLLKEKGYKDSLYYIGKKANNLLQELNTLYAKNSKAAQLNREVTENINTIGHKYAHRIESLLGQYQLNVVDSAKEELSLQCSIEKYNERCYCVYAAYQVDTDAESHILERVKSGKRLGVDDFLKKIDMAQYDDNQNYKICEKVAQQFENMYEEQNSKRFSIAKKYAEYYPILDTDKLPSRYANIGFIDPYVCLFNDNNFNYTELHHFKKLQITRETSILTKNLSVDFFNKKGCSYKLNKIGDNQWQVFRTDENGTTANTSVFREEPVFDNISISQFCDKDKKYTYKDGKYTLVTNGDREEEFVAKQESDGYIKIIATEILYEIQGKEDQEYNAIREPIEEEFNKYNKLYREQIEIYRSAEREALLRLEAFENNPEAFGFKTNDEAISKDNADVFMNIKNKIAKKIDGVFSSDTEKSKLPQTTENGQIALSPKKDKSDSR